MSALKSKKLIISLVVIILVTFLWVTRIIPSGICILTATRYINDKYPGRNFQYSSVEYSSAHRKYLVHFVDNDGININIMTSIIGVSYDPLDPPG